MKRLGFVVCCLSIGLGWVWGVDATSITLVAGSGYVFREGELAVAIDALTSYGSTGEMQEMMAAGTPPLDLDLILVSHSHFDHFDRSLVAANMLTSPSFVLVAPEIDEPVVLDVSGLELTLLSFPHPLDGLPANVGFRFELGSVAFIHPGDLYVNMASELFEAYGVNAGDINVAILPAFMFPATGLYNVLWGLGVDCFTPTHARPLDLARACEWARRTFPNTLCFHELMEEKEYVAGTSCESAP